MRCPAAEKLEIIRLVERSALPVRRTPAHLGIPRATFHRRCGHCRAGGPEALADKPSRPGRVRNRIPDGVCGRIVDLALAEPEPPPRELAARSTDAEHYSVSEAPVCRPLEAQDPIASPAFIVIEAADEFHTRTTAPNQLRRTDFAYLKVAGWGWFHLSTVLDDSSRCAIARKLRTTMAAGDATDTLELALTASGRTRARVRRRPRLPSDDGPSHIAGDPADRLAGRRMGHVRGAPRHPQTQGKIGRRPQTPKSRIPLENYDLPGELEAEVEAFVERYNHRRPHEGLRNLTPADAYFGRGGAIPRQRERIRRQTVQRRRLLHRQQAA